MTKQETFVTMVTMLCESFNRPATDGLLEGYWLALSDLSEEQLKAACAKALATSKFMPAPAELLAFVRPRMDVTTAAVVAWQAVRKAIDEHDYLVASIDFGPLVNATIRNLGGWDTMCKATLPELDNPGWLRKRFEEAYRALSSADPTTLHGDELSGALPEKFINPKHVIVAVDGSPPPKRIEANDNARHSIAEHIRELADGKS